MSPSRKSDKPRRPRRAHATARHDAASRLRKRASARSAVERDQLDLIQQMRASETRLSDAIVTAFTRSDGHALAAFGVVLGFVARTQARARR